MSIFFQVQKQLKLIKFYHHILDYKTGFSVNKFKKGTIA